jgi:phosphomannomutase
MMSRLRSAPPKKIGDHAVVAVSDFAAQTRTAADGTATKLTLPASNVMVFELEGGSRIIARPSGTEPKVKFYFDVREVVAAGEAVAVAEARADETRKRLAEVFQALAG